MRRHGNAILALRIWALCYFVIAFFVEDNWAQTPFGGGVYTSKAILAIEVSWIFLALSAFAMKNIYISIISLNMFLILNVPFALYILSPSSADFLFGSTPEMSMDKGAVYSNHYFSYIPDVILTFILCLIVYILGMYISIRRCDKL